MSTERKPLVSDEQIEAVAIDKHDGSLSDWLVGAAHVRDLYEAARAKDAELIQRLVDAFSLPTLNNQSAEWQAYVEHKREVAIAAAKAAGFTPTPEN